LLSRLRNAPEHPQEQDSQHKKNAIDTSTTTIAIVSAARCQGKLRKKMRPMQMKRRQKQQKKAGKM
jgi:hypothetical protein